jgi:hypothetical protein
METAARMPTAEQDARVLPRKRSRVAVAGGAQQTDETIAGINVTPSRRYRSRSLIIFMVSAKLVVSKSISLSICLQASRALPRTGSDRSERPMFVRATAPRWSTAGRLQRRRRCPCLGHVRAQAQNPSFARLIQVRR